MMPRRELFPILDAAGIMGPSDKEAPTRDYLHGASDHALSLRLYFTPPSLPSAEARTAPCGEGGAAEDEAGALREVLIPVRPVGLVTLTIDAFLKEFMRCVSKRYGQGPAPCGLAVRALWIRRAAPHDSELSPKAFDGAVSWPCGARVSRPHSTPSGLGSCQKMIRIDALMNGDNTLDAFFPIPRPHPAESRGSPAVHVYDAYVEWEEALSFEGQAALRGGERLLSTSGGDSSSIKAKDRHHSPWTPRRASEGGYLPPRAVAVPLEAILEPIRLNPLRSVYRDLRPLSTSPPPADSERKKEGSGEAGEGDARTDAPSLDSMQLNSESLWELLSSNPKTGLGNAKVLARHRAERRKLWEEEISARNDLIYREESAYRLILELASDSMRSVRSLSSLQGELIQDERVAGLMCRRCRYPADSLPLADRTTSVDAERLHTVSKQTTTLGFLFASDNLRKPKPRVVSEEENRELKRADDPRMFRFRNLCVGIRRKRATEVRAGSGGLQAFKAPAPLSTCSLPKEMPLARSPDSACGESLPEEVCERLLREYSAGRHKVISSERRAYRDLLKILHEVMLKQKQLDERVLRQAYAEEIGASQVFDLDRYATYYGDF